MNVAQLLARAGRASRDQPAVAVGQVVFLTYGQLAERVARIGGGLARDYKLEPGDRVAVVMPNIAEYVEILFAIWWAGLVAVPVNWKLHPREVDYILSDSGALLCFVASDWAYDMQQTSHSGETPITVISCGTDSYDDLLAAEAMAMVDRSATDVAWLFYTSGTTGRPKGVMITHRNLSAMTLNYLADVDSIAVGDSIVHAAPMSHGSGLYSLPHVARSALNVVPESRGFDSAEVAMLVGFHQRVTLWAAPTMVRRMLDLPALGMTDMSNLKTIVYGGGPMYVSDLQEAINVLGQKFVQIYGQGESPMTIARLTRAHHSEVEHPRYLEHLGSVGTAFTGVELRIASGNGRDPSSEEPGEVLVRGDTVMKGYWQNPKATAQALEGGWLHTGDIGILDCEGFLTLKDRSKDLVISGGANIYPREVEEVLLRHEQVAEASAVGRRHPEWGEELIAFVVLKPGAAVDGQALDALCLENLARFKRPRGYRFIEALPKNSNGKVLKTELRKWLEDERDGRAT